MLVMFMCIIIGFVLKKKRLIPDNADAVMAKLENYIFVPALILSNFMNYCTISSLSQYYTLIIYSAIGLCLVLAISIPMSRIFVRDDRYKRNIYKYALTFANFSFMGNAIVPEILGAADPEILYKYLLFTLPLNLVVYTWGIIILIPKGETNQNPIKNLLNPIFVAILTGAALGLTGFSAYVPSFIATTIDYCKACMAPLAMILTGFVIGGYSIRGLLADKKVYIVSVLRLVVIPVILLGILKLLRASDLAIILAFFAYATPVGMNTIIFPAAYGGETRTGASMAMISHTLCIISIPVLYAVLTRVI